MENFGDGGGGPQLFAQLCELDLDLFPLRPLEKRALLDGVDAVFGFMLRSLGAEVLRVLPIPVFPSAAPGENAFGDELRDARLTDIPILGEFLLSNEPPEKTFFLAIYKYKAP